MEAFFLPLPYVQQAGITRFKDSALRVSAAPTRQLPSGAAYRSSPGSSLALLLGRKSGAADALLRRFLDCLAAGLMFSLSSVISLSHAHSSASTAVCGAGLSAHSGSVCAGSASWGGNCFCSSELGLLSMGSCGVGAPGASLSREA